MTTFANLGINDEICRSLAELGLVSATAIQEQVIPAMLTEPVDMIGLAQTGTGKTAAFGLPLIQNMDSGRKETQAVILCPTRELCLQVTRDLTAYARFVRGIRVVAVYGGARIDQQIRSIQQGAHIIVATPGRLHDLIRRRAVDLAAVRFAVLDEADEMLQMGFQDELNAILASTPAKKHTLLFSATMSNEAAGLAGKYMKDPVEITAGTRNAGSDTIRHLYFVVQMKDRYAAMRRIIDMNPDMYAIVFCRTRQETRELAEQLIQDGYNSDALHGDLSQSQRDQVMEGFRSRRLRLLVATDVAARGLDVTDLTHVINYNLPDDAANYTHRSGRTGRAGKTGISIAIIHTREQNRLRDIERRIGQKFEKGYVPSGREICETQVLSRLEGLKASDVEHALIEPFMPAIVQSLASLDRDELIKKLIAAECTRVLQYYRNAPDLNARERQKAAPAKALPSNATTSNQRGNRPQFTRFFLNIGKRDGVHPGRLIGEINDAFTGAQRIRVGKIEIMDNSALLEADERFADQIVGIFEGLMVNGKRVSVQVGAASGGKNTSSPYDGTRKKGQKAPGRGPRQKNGAPFLGSKKVRCAEEKFSRRRKEEQVYLKSA